MSAKDIIVKPISKRTADLVCKSIHYSGKVDPRSQLHFGVFYRDKCEGVMQFGPSIDKAKMQNLVRNTHWNGFLELNRMAFSDMLPKNSESRALGYAFRLIKKHYPHIKWVVSFADGAQCGDGTIYRATGFKLTQINKNKSMWRMPDGEVCCQLSFTIGGSTNLRRRYGYRPTDTFTKFAKRIGAKCIEGFQLRYIKLLYDDLELNCAELPYSDIERLGAGMYRGIRRVEHESNVSVHQTEEGGATPTYALHTQGGFTC